MLDIAKDDIHALMLQIGRNARAAAHPLSIASAERKHAALVSMAREIETRRNEILAANAIDLENARASDMAPSFVDRLTLSARSRNSGIPSAR